MLREAIDRLNKMIFGDGKLPKRPKLFAPEEPTRHWGSKKNQNKRWHKLKLRAAQKRAKQSRKRNRRK